MAMLVENAALEKAKSEIEKASANLKSSGTAFIGTLTTTLSTFSGETKDALMQYKIGTSGTDKEGTLAYFLEKQVPDLVDGLAKLLEGNRTTIDESDRKLAEAISGKNN
ncbi:MAG: hypothetical protein IKP25_05980 [Ruminococcus sp.]|nr:hypothetical protein [Ruminococcus sp.]